MTNQENRKILITDDVHPLLVDGLQAIGEVAYEPKIPYDQVKARIGDYWGIVINSKIIVDREFLDRAHHLEWVGRLGSGLDIIDLPAAKAANVTIISSPGGNSNAVGEHALGMLLALFNKLIACHEMVCQLEPWDRESMRGHELDGKTVGVIGCGNAGSAFVKKLRGFDVEVLIFDKYLNDLPAIHNHQSEATLDELLTKSDIVSLHIPLTDETKNLVDEGFLNRMKRSSVLINTSRGSIVNLRAAIEALKSRKLSGLCLDVFPNEKPSRYNSDDKNIMTQLSEMQQVVMSPHVAGWTIESKRKLAEILLEKIMYFHRKPEL